MTTTTQEVKKSYTDRLIEHLEEQKVLTKEIKDSIKDFSKQESVRIQKTQKEQEGLMNFGKYKGKRFVDIYKIDKGYIEWLNKNSKYLREDGREIVEQLLNS